MLVSTMFAGWSGAPNLSAHAESARVAMRDGRCLGAIDGPTCWSAQARVVRDHLEDVAAGGGRLRSVCNNRADVPLSRRGHPMAVSGFSNAVPGAGKRLAHFRRRDAYAVGMVSPPLWRASVYAIELPAGLVRVPAQRGRWHVTIVCSSSKSTLRGGSGVGHIRRVSGTAGESHPSAREFFLTDGFTSIKRSASRSSLSRFSQHVDSALVSGRDNLVHFFVNPVASFPVALLAIHAAEKTSSSGRTRRAPACCSCPTA